MTYNAALITGASKRLGKAMAVSLAARGTAVCIHYASSKDAAFDTVDEITAIGGTAVAVQADLLDEDQAMGLVANATAQLGMPLDILVNNASIFEYDTLSSATLQSWDRHIGSNLRAPFILTQKFAAQVASNTRACVINMIDQRVRKLTPEFMTYTIAKAGLWTLTQTSAQALAPHIRVNAIGPGSTLPGARQSKAHFDAQRANSILQMGADPDDIVAAMDYFLNAPAVTGQLVCVDGGQHLGWQTPDILGVQS